MELGTSILLAHGQKALKALLVGWERSLQGLSQLVGAEGWALPRTSFDGAGGGEQVWALPPAGGCALAVLLGAGDPTHHPNPN